VAVGAQQRLGAGARAAPVEAAGPERAGPGEPDRSDQGQDGDDHAEHREAGLALAEGDQGEEEVRPDGGQDVGAVLPLVLGQPVDPEGGEPGEDQADQGRGDHHHLHALAAGLRPVDVVEVQDQRELVEHEARPDAEQHRAECGAESVPAARDRAETPDHGEDDPGHDVVDVDPAGLDIAERPLAGPDEAGDDPGEQEREHEGAEGEEQRQLARLGDVPLPPISHMCTLSPGVAAASATAG
jgi:hypothetical protein